MTYIEKRSLYSVGDLLGDVGGFNDGPMLVCQLLLSAYSAISFKSKLIATSYFDSDSDAKRRSSMEHRKLRADIMSHDCHQLDPTTTSPTFQRALRSADQLQQSVLKNLFCCAFQSQRQRRLKEVVETNLERQLDIRSFVKTRLDLRLLIKRTMSKKQRKLFAYQRDRLPHLNDSNEDSFDSSLDVDQDIHHPDTIMEFTKSLGKYRVESDLDRKLLLGVLVRDCHLGGHELLAATSHHDNYPTLSELVVADAEF